MDPQQQPAFTPPLQVQQPSGSSKTKKLVILLIGLFVLGLVLLIGSFLIGGDDTQSSLQKVIIHHDEQLRISDLAEKYSEEFAFREFEANLSTLVISDRLSLATLYNAEIDPEATASITDIEAASRFESAAKTNDFAAEFSATMTPLITSTITEMEGLRTATNNVELQQVLDRAIANQTSLGEQLNDL